MKMKIERAPLVKHVFFLAIMGLLILMGCTKEDNSIDALKTFTLRNPLNYTNDQNPDYVPLDWSTLPSGYFEMRYSNLTIWASPYYEVYLWKKVTNDTILHEKLDVNHFALIGADGSTTYQWKVVAWANERILIESNIWEFTTEPKMYKGNITFSTQSEVDAFAGGDYRIIGGDLTILNSDIDPVSNLSPLSEITNIKGDVIINNTNLTILAGFTNLEFVAGNLEIKDNELLTEIQGFKNLELIGGVFFLSGNNQLVMLDEFSKLKSVQSDLVITINNSLTSIDNFNQLDSVFGELTIGYNDLLETINGFHNLSYISGKLGISGHNRLTSVKGFENVNLIGDQVYHIAKGLEIRDNGQLSEIPEFNKVNSIGGNFRVDNNDHLNVFTGFENLITINGDFEIGESNLLTSIPGMNNLEVIGGSFKIDWNWSLATVAGFENLKTIRGAFIVENNAVLKTISGLNRLESIDNNLVFNTNKALTTIDAFDKLQIVGGQISVVFNYQLNSFCFLKHLVVFGIFQGYVVHYNMVNPTIDEIKELVCD